MDIGSWFTVMVIGIAAFSLGHGFANGIRGRVLRILWQSDPDKVERLVGAEEIRRLRSHVHAPKGFHGNAAVHALIVRRDEDDAQIMSLRRVYNWCRLLRVVGVAMIVIGFLIP